ncbi:MAG: hypothetical protein EOO09_22395 [Chitinophagaceae bacterium]|nr:MAG: hypothetical protein EOO09_22395 [Chitinophagaceae bacterium]
MKYHYQFVSKTSARIELIAEYESEHLLLAQARQSGKASAALLSLFSNGIANYLPGAVESETVFMNFPTVALCRFVQHPTPTQSPKDRNQMDQFTIEL